MIWVPSVLALKRWLLLVASFRSLAVFIGIFKPDNFKKTVINRQPELAHPLFGRLFAAWTTVTCILCVTCAQNPHEKGLYIATTSSFLVANAFFLSEFLIFKTVGAKGFTSPFIVATVSSIWMIAGYNTYVNGSVTGGAASGTPHVEL